MGEFVGEEIEVGFDRKPGPPSSFVWRGAVHRITCIEARRQVLDFSRPWYRRHHRDHYVVQTDQGLHCRIYFNRGPGRRYWVLYEIVE
jgi:hypothetical protein